MLKFLNHQIMKHSKCPLLLLAFISMLTAGLSYLFIIDNAFSLFKGLSRTPVFGIEPAGIKFLAAIALLFGSTSTFGHMIAFKRKHYRERQHYLRFTAGMVLITLSGYLLTSTEAAIQHPANNNPILPPTVAYATTMLCYITGLLMILHILKDDIVIALHQLLYKGGRNFFEVFEEYLATPEKRHLESHYQASYLKLLQFNGSPFLSFRQFDEAYLEQLVQWMKTKGYSGRTGLEPNIIESCLSQYRNVFEYAQHQHGETPAFPLQKLNYKEQPLNRPTINLLTLT
jgi:hypothetical protein